jgi:hypothetical protein
MAGLVIPTVGDNRLRHEALQRFMLANDSTTLAVEVPIWLARDTIAELEREHGVALVTRSRGVKKRSRTSPTWFSTCPFSQPAVGVQATGSTR